MSKFFLEVTASTNCGGEEWLLHVTADNLDHAKTKAREWLESNKKYLDFPLNYYGIHTIDRRNISEEDIEVVHHDMWG